MRKFQLLSNRALISLEGTDCIKFLQGIVTNDVISLVEGSILYSLMLTPQGRFMYDFFIFRHQNKLYIDHESQFTQDLITKLKFYKLRADVTIEDLTNDYCIAALDDNPVTCGDCVFRDPRSPKLGYRSYIKSVDLDSFAKANTHTKFYSQSLYNYLIPEPHKDMIQGRSFPLEYEMDSFSAISFTKGCYLGQELTARTKHRGVVRKKLYKLVTEENLKDIETGEPITVDGNKIGIFCSFYGLTVKALLRIEDYNNLSKNTKIVVADKILHIANNAVDA